MIFPLLKRNLKSSLMTMIGFIAILAMYFGVIIYMYDPAMSEMLNQYQEILPEMMNAVGMSGIATNLIEFVGIYLYGFLMLMIPMVFTIMMVNKTLVKYLDSGSMAIILAAPNSRFSVIMTQLFSLIMNILIFMLTITLIGYGFAQTMFPNELDLIIYFKLNFSIFNLHLLLGSITFLSACIFNESKHFTLYGVGLPIIFLLTHMLSNMGDKLAFFKYFSVFSLFPKEAIIAGESSTVMNLVMIGGAFILFSIAIKVFTKKDLSL